MREKKLRSGDPALLIPILFIPFSGGFSSFEVDVRASDFVALLIVYDGGNTVFSLQTEQNKEKRN